MEEASISARAAGESDFTLIKVPLPNVGLAPVFDSIRVLRGSGRI
jgi:hypothetical protein